MISSRKISDLHPEVQAMALEHKARCEAAGIDLLIYCTFRDHEAQDALYEIGRSKAGKIVTNARGGQSWHNWRRAYDCVPVRFGKAVWGTKGDDGLLWQKVGEIGIGCGLEWAGEWRRFKEMPHFQFTGGLTLGAMKARSGNG